MKAALLLVDLQRYFLAAAGLCPVAWEVVRRAAELLEGCRRSGVPVAHGRTTITPGKESRLTHWRLENRRICLEGTAGHACPQSLEPHPGERVVEKCGYSVFEDPTLHAWLTDLGCDTLILAGVHLHGCVRAAVLDAYRYGYRVIVAEDATASDDPMHAAVTRRYLEDRAVRFVSVSYVLSSLEGGARDRNGHHGSPVIAHRSPRDLRRVLFEVADAGEERIDEVIGDAHRAARAWRATSRAQRAAKLRAVVTELEERAEPLVEMLVEQIGKPITQARQEMALAAVFVRTAIEHADVAAVDAPGGLAGRAGYRRVPLGVVALVTPWNNPVAVPLGKLAPALLYGNAAVWKPAPAGQLIAQAVLACFHAAGLDPALIGLIEGGARTARRVVNDERIDAVAVTGSLSAGFAVGEIATRRHIPMQAELGGNNASIVWRDADPQHAAGAIAAGAFGFAGQRCTANRRVIVDERIEARFMDHLKRAVGGLVWGDPRDPQTDVGPVISASRREGLEMLIAHAREGGCTIDAPHDLRANRDTELKHGAYIAPTIITCDDPTHSVVCDESFGPILVVQRAQSFDHALDLLNGVPQGLVASLFTSSQALEGWFLEEARAGILKLNQSTAGASPDLPFGGWKASGIGPPEHGAFDMDFYTRPQAIYKAMRPTLCPSDA